MSAAAPDRRRAAGRRSDEQLSHALLAHSPDLTIIVGADGCLRAASASAERMLGWEPGTVVGTDVFALIHPDDAGPALESFANTSQVAGVHERLELRIRRVDGTYAPVEVMANNLLDDPAVRGVIVTIRDLTDRYRAEDALVTSTLRMRTLIASLPGAVLVESAERKVALANDQLCELFDLGGEGIDLVGTSIDAVRQHIAARLSSPVRFGAFVEELVATGLEATGVELDLADGRTIETDHRVIAVDGVVRERLWLFRDVTRRKQSEALLTAARDRALEALDAKSQFLAMLSHEVRTPMNGIIGMLDVLRDRSNTLDDETVEILSGVRAAADSLMDVLDDSLDVARIEAGQLELHEVDFDLREVVEGATETMGPLARDRRVAVVTVVDPSLPTLVTGDPGRLRQVLLNLLGNAIRFTEDGEVIVRVVADRDVGDRQRVRIRVSDSGAGIAPEALEQVFEPFVQGSGATVGSGLGLAICRRLVTLMGGEIGATSEVGHGSTFWFTVVVAPASPPPPTLVADVRTATVVAARAGTRDALVELLRTWGVDVVEVVDAPDTTVGPVGTVGPDLVVATIDQSHAIGAITGPHTRVLLLGCSHDALPISDAVLVSLPARTTRLFAAVCGAARPRPRPTELSSPPLRGRVLLAEDNEVNRRIATIALEHLGLQVTGVGDGAAAVEAMAQGEFDVVLMDCRMPEVDGYEASRRIRAAEAATGAHVPIVALTAGALPVDRAACQAAGMDDFLAKPVTGARLRTVLEPWLVDRAGPGPNDEAPAPAVDRAVLGALADELGDDTILAEVLAAYLQELPVRREAIAAAAGAGDAETVRTVSHTLKSSSAALGALALSAACADMEQLGRSGDGPAIARKVGDLLAHIDRADTEIRAWYRRLLAGEGVA